MSASIGVPAEPITPEEREKATNVLLDEAMEFLRKEGMYATMQALDWVRKALAARDEEIARLTSDDYAMATMKLIRLRREAEARVAQLEAAINELCVVAVTDSNTRIRPGSRVGSALDKLCAVAKGTA